jgi:hypothetical protein
MLITAASVSFAIARRDARDARRTSDLIQMRLALALYYQDYGVYPSIFANGAHDVPAYSIDGASWAYLAQALSPYIDRLPKDPLNRPSSLFGSPPLGGDNYYYFYYSQWDNGGPSANGVEAGQKTNLGYLLAARLENKNHPVRCAVRSYHSYESVDLGPNNVVPLCPPAGYSSGWDNQNLVADH